MSSTHHIGNPADSVRRTALTELKNQFFDDLGHLNALSVILERLKHHAIAMADDDTKELSQRELAAMVTAAQCVVSAMFDVTERQQERLSVIETTVDDATYTLLKRLANADGLSPDELASRLVSEQVSGILRVNQG